MSVGDNTLIVLSENAGGTGGIFTRSFMTIEESSDLVGEHEGQSEFFVITEVDAPVDGFVSRSTSIPLEIDRLPVFE